MGSKYILKKRTRVDKNKKRKEEERRLDWMEKKLLREYEVKKRMQGVGSKYGRR